MKLSHEIEIKLTFPDQKSNTYSNNPSLLKMFAQLLYLRLRKT